MADSIAQWFNWVQFKSYLVRQYPTATYIMEMSSYSSVGDMNGDMTLHLHVDTGKPCFVFIQGGTSLKYL